MLYKYHSDKFPIIRMATIAQSVDSLSPDRRAGVRGSPGEKPTCMLMVPGACKIRRGCNVLLVSLLIKPLGVPKRVSRPLLGGSKLRWHVSGSSFGMTPGSSAIAHSRCSSPTSNPPNTQLNPIIKPTEEKK